MFRILLADDVGVTLAMEKAFLEERNFRVTATTSAKEALHLARSMRPDLVVIDFEMPEMTGAEVCTALRADPQTARIPVVILSIRDDSAIRRSCQEAGAVAFVRKADGREALLQSVDTALGVSRRHVRAPCQFAVGLHDGHHRFEGQVLNISAGGAFLVAPANLTIGQALHLRFALPDTGFEVEVLGEVVRIQESSPTGFGVQFLQTNAASNEALRSFVERNL